MNTWICRILIFVFFVNCFPVQTWAQTPRASKRTRALETQVTRQANKYLYEQWQDEVAELEKVLQEEDLTPDERKFANLELEIAKLNMEHINAFDEYNDIAGVNKLYSARREVLLVQEQNLEKKEKIRSFYQTVQSDRMIAAAVYALHQHVKNSNSRYMAAKQHSEEVATAFQRDHATVQDLRAQSERMRQELNLDGRLPDYLIQQPSSLRVDMPQRVPRQVGHSRVRSSQILERWANNTITVEELVEYADPTGELLGDVADTAAAAELLFYIYYGYNLQKTDLDEETLANAMWLAKRLQYRAHHQLHELELQAQQRNSLDYVQARGNMMRLAIQIRNFLNAHPTDADQASLLELDKQLPEYAAIKDELSGYRPNVWPYSSVANAITEDIKNALQNRPDPSSRDHSLLIQDLSYTTGYLIATNNVGKVAEIIALLDEDEETIHGKNEEYVSAVFGSIFDTMLAYTISPQTQQTVRQLLVCAAAPVCYYNNDKKTNAVNIRVQALAVGSMLRQVVKNHRIPTAAPVPVGEQAEINTTLSQAIFDDPNFRQAMAAYTADIYGPTQSWSREKIKRYGLKLDELQELQDYLARIFESFLPVRAPKTTIKTIQEGAYKNCWIREIDTQHLVSLTHLQATSSFIEPGESADGYACHELPKNKSYGGLSTVIVLNSSGYSVGMTRFNPFNRKQMFEDFATALLTEIATWYLFGAAFKGLGYLWKGVRAATVAANAATKASSGFKLARFNSKFSQVWKLSTNGWQTEMGLVNVAKNGDKVLVEMHRPGFQGLRMELNEAVLQGNSLKSLRGRILLRRAIQHNVYANVGKTAQAMNITAATKNANLLGTLSDDLAQELTRPLTKAEQTIVQDEHALVRAMETELTEGANFEMIPAATDAGAAMSLYRPIKTPTPLIDLSTGLPERAILDPLTGNVTGELSSQYLGTIVTPYTQNVVAYNMAAGITQFPSSKFLGRWLANRYSIIPQTQRLSKFVFTLTALDQPIYHWYTKPYMENFTKRQDADLARETGYNPDKNQGNTAPKTLLEGIQGLTTNLSDATGAAMQGAFLGVNQLLNYVLPNPIQVLRRDLFKFTTDLSSAIDDPLAHALNINNEGFLPLPGSVLTLYPLLASDPTPTYSDAARTQYEILAHQQNVEESMSQHNISSFQQQMDQEIESLETGLPVFLQKNNEILNSLPKASKEVKRAYKTYIQAVKAARKLAPKDLEKAQKDCAEASEKFVNTQADIMQRAVKSYVVQRKGTLPDLLAQYRQNYDFLFTEQVEAEYTNFFVQYYNQYERDLIAFFTAGQTSLQTGQPAQRLQEQANLTLQQHDLAAAARRAQLDQELNKRVEIVNTIHQEWERDYRDMCPSNLAFFPKEAQEQIQQVFNDFIAGVEASFQQVTNSAELQEAYSKLVKTRNTRFTNIKNYWINVNPWYERLFNRTISVAYPQQQSPSEGTPTTTAQ